LIRHTDIGSLLERHQLLDDAIASDRAGFLSDWNGDNPYAEAFLGTDLIATLGQGPSPSRYKYFDDDLHVSSQISLFHQMRDNLSVTERQLIAGPGSSSILAALSIWIAQKQLSEVIYIPPLYHSFHYVLRSLGVKLRPVAPRQLLSAGADLHLPARQSILLLSDPVWYAGRRVPETVMERIAAWQRGTESYVIVDGSFQYMQWGASRAEHSRLLAPELTLRIVSPAKALAVPSFRFAYLLHPESEHRTLSFLYDNVVGSASVGDVRFAVRAMDILNSDGNNQPLTGYLADTYSRLVDEELIATDIAPECGYFAFVKLRGDVPHGTAMDETFFELSGYPGYSRINLMLARNLLRQPTTTGLQSTVVVNSRQL
jgi:bifunctional pyridoxal-dependent enzyme with beta-cystathionase and maltose regulon repressor activities